MEKYGNLQHKSIPGPQIQVCAISPNLDSLVVEFGAVIDTAAVVTCVPETVILQLDESKLAYSIRKVRGAVGKETTRKSFIVNLKIKDCIFENIEVITLDKEYALIGRDILNRYNVFFDGPNGIWGVEKHE